MSSSMLDAALCVSILSIVLAFHTQYSLTNIIKVVTRNRFELIRGLQRKNRTRQKQKGKSIVRCTVCHPEERKALSNELEISKTQPPESSDNESLIVDNWPFLPVSQAQITRETAKSPRNTKAPEP